MTLIVATAIVAPIVSPVIANAATTITAQKTAQDKATNKTEIARISGLMEAGKKFLKLKYSKKYSKTPTIQVYSKVKNMGGGAVVTRKSDGYTVSNNGFDKIPVKKWTSVKLNATNYGLNQNKEYRYVKQGQKYRYEIHVSVPKKLKTGVKYNTYKAVKKAGKWQVVKSGKNQVVVPKYSYMIRQSKWLTR